MYIFSPYNFVIIYNYYLQLYLQLYYLLLLINLIN